MTAGLVCTVAAGAAAQRPTFHVEEATVAQIQAALKSGAITCRGIVDQYLARIAAYDKQGPAINAIIVVNPKAQATADSLDRRMKAGGFVGPLHCIPIIVKDNYDTYDLPTTAGSTSLRGAQPEFDAPVVKRIRDAGAIVLAKSNMAEFAFSPYETVSSMLGTTRNPYDLQRVPAGSSGGSAAAMAASFGAVALGTDTGNSIRGPSSHNALVGIRPTMGLTSRAGVVPLALGADVTGPIARTVADAVAVLQVMAGLDPRDKATAASAGHVSTNYAAFLKADGLKGARIGVLHAACPGVRGRQGGAGGAPGGAAGAPAAPAPYQANCYDTRGTDSEVVALFQHAIAELRAAGATVVDSVTIDSLPRGGGGGGCSSFKFELNDYLAEHGSHVPVHSLDEIVASGKFDPSIAQRLQGYQTSTSTADSPGCLAREQNRARFGAAVEKTMDAQKLDALIYPTWSYPPRLIGDLTSPAGDNNQSFSPSSGFPAITVPMGFTRNNTLPDGLQFLGRGWDEGTLIKLAYAYEQATKHRRPPASTPPR